MKERRFSDNLKLDYEYEYLIQAISKDFVYGINYTDKNEDRCFGLVTLNSKILKDCPIPDDCNLELKNSKLEEYVFWDLHSNSKLTIPVEGRNAFYFHFLDFLNIKSVSQMLDNFDSELIEEYNKKVIAYYDERKQAIIDAKDELIKEYNMSFTEEEVQYYVNLFNTHFFIDNKINNVFLIKLCMLLKANLRDMLYGPAEKDLKIARDQWMLVIKNHIATAKGQLDGELSRMDKFDPSYEFEKEEVEIIKELLDKIPEEFIEDLQDCKNYEDLLQCWPPLLLPAPQWIIDQPSGENAFAKLKTRVDPKFLDL